MYHSFYQKILGSMTVFNVDKNKKCSLSSKSAYWNNFLRSCDTEDRSNDAENSALHLRNKSQINRYTHTERRTPTQREKILLQAAKSLFTMLEI